MAGVLKTRANSLGFANACCCCNALQCFAPFDFKFDSAVWNMIISNDCDPGPQSIFATHPSFPCWGWRLLPQQLRTFPLLDITQWGNESAMKTCYHFCVSCWRHDHLLCVVVRTLRRLAVRREKTVNSCLCYFKTLIFEPRAPALQAIFLPAELGLQPFRGLRGFYCRQYLFWSVMNAWIFIPYIFRVCTPKVSRFIKRNSWSEGELLLFMFSEK